MNVPLWLLRLLPMWEYVCPKCREDVPKSSHVCPHCGKRFPLALRVPPSFLRNPKKLEEYVHKHVFPRINEFERNYLTKYFTVLFSSGWENSGGSDVTDGGAWTGTNGSPTVVSSPVHHGSYSAKLAGANNNCYKDLGASYSNLWARVYYRTDSVVTSGEWGNILGLYATTTTRVRAGIWNNGSTVRWFLNVEGTQSVYEEAVSANTWYCLEIEWDAVAGECNLYRNGTLIITVTKDVTGDTVDRFYAGWLSGSGSEDWFIDCVAVADAYIGPEATVTNVTVTDSLGLSDAVRRNKSFAIADASSLADSVLRNKTLAITDSVGANDQVLGNKLPLIVAEAVSLSELITVIAEAIVKTVIDTIGASDAALINKTAVIADSVNLADSIIVNKILQLTETINLVETIQVGVGGAKKTKLFLILGDLAVQLAGE